MHRNLFIMLLIAALSLFTVACGDDDDDASADTTEDSSHDHDSHADHDSMDHDGMDHDMSGMDMSGMDTSDTETSPNTLMTAEGTFEVTYAPAAAEVPLNELFTLEVMVSDPADAARDLSTLTIMVDAQMPEHGHGMNVTPTVTPVADAPGSFTVEGMQLHMPGYWVLTVMVMDGDASEMASFNINL